MEIHVGDDVVHAALSSRRRVENATDLVTSCIDELRAKSPNLKHLLILSRFHRVEWQNGPCSVVFYVSPGKYYFDDF